MLFFIVKMVEIKMCLYVVFNLLSGRPSFLLVSYMNKNLHNKIFIQIFEMGMNYQDEILYISTRIKELRKERKLTVQELAYRCDMERSNLSRIEAGRTNLTVKTICSICNALSVNMRDVIR